MDASESVHQGGVNVNAVRRTDRPDHECAGDVRRDRGDVHVPSVRVGACVRGVLSNAAKPQGNT